MEMYIMPEAKLAMEKFGLKKVPDLNNDGKISVSEVNKAHAATTSKPVTVTPKA